MNLYAKRTSTLNKNNRCIDYMLLVQAEHVALCLFSLLCLVCGLAFLHLVKGRKIFSLSDVANILLGFFYFIKTIILGLEM